MATGPSDPLEPSAREAALADLRKHERTPVTLIVDYDGPEDFLSDYTVNLSSGGTFIHTSRTIAVGTAVQITICIRCRVTRPFSERRSIRKRTTRLWPR